ncbi:unnamed protein product, partial [Rotaria magnacalcarata]
KEIYGTKVPSNLISLTLIKFEDIMLQISTNALTFLLGYRNSLPKRESSQE